MQFRIKRSSLEPSAAILVMWQLWLKASKWVTKSMILDLLTIIHNAYMSFLYRLPYDDWGKAEYWGDLRFVCSKKKSSRFPGSPIFSKNQIGQAWMFSPGNMFKFIIPVFLLCVRHIARRASSLFYMQNRRETPDAVVAETRSGWHVFIISPESIDHFWAIVR